MSKNNFFPKVAIIPLTYKCNGKCVMCNIWKNCGTPDMSMEKLKDFFCDPIIVDHLQSVNLTGGEPVLRKDLINVVELILKHCNSINTITINTNGYFYKEYRELVYELYCLKKNIKEYTLVLYVSLDGLGEEHDKVRGVSGFYDNVIKTIDLLSNIQTKYDFTLSINFTISAYNYMHMMDVAEFVAKKNLKIDFTYSMESAVYFENVLDKNIRTFDELEKDEIIVGLNKLIKLGNLSYSTTYYRNLINMLKGIERKIGCIFVDEGLFLRPNGDVFPCWASQHKIGNLYEETISQIWLNNNTSDKKASIKEICRTCYNNCYVDFKRVNAIKKIIEQRGK